MIYNGDMKKLGHDGKEPTRKLKEGRIKEKWTQISGHGGHS